MNDLSSVLWPITKAADALIALARQSGLPLPAEFDALKSSLPNCPIGADSDALGESLDLIAESLGLEVKAVTATYAEVNRMLSAAGPALLAIEREDGLALLAILSGRRRRARVLGPELDVHRVRASMIRQAVCNKNESSLADTVEQLVQEAGISARRRRRAREAILRCHLNQTSVAGCWLLRLSAGSSFWHHVWHSGVVRHLSWALVSHTSLYVLWISSWWIVGRAALEGHTDHGWLSAWVLLLATLIPVRMFANWSQGMVSVKTGTLLRQRLLYGSLQFDTEKIRREGSGHLLGRVFESDVVETLALGGGFLALFAGIELVLALCIFAFGSGGFLLTALLMTWCALGILMSLRYHVRRRAWTDTRIWMSHDLIERMMGHRTRLAQEPPEQWHRKEDQTLEHYLSTSAKTDQAAVRLSVIIPRGWLIVGTLGLLPSLIAHAASEAQLAVAIGGIIFSYRALQKLTSGMSQISGAVIAWRAIAPFFSAVGEERGTTEAERLTNSSSHHPRTDEIILNASNLTFRYRANSRLVLDGTSVRVRFGDRILMQGTSGGGKSTLCAVLAGLREPNAGQVRLYGLDLRTLGTRRWRKRVAFAPQFHENHVLTGTFLFNVLMGQPWPPKRKSIDQAEVICRELGLGDLLDRMPAGLEQMVGEGGWQLSHGERSRLYVARAILQGADLVILDESLAALDPTTFSQALRCVNNRVRSLVLIAHV